MKSGSKLQPVNLSKQQSGNRFAVNSEHQLRQIKHVLYQVEKLLPELRGKAFDRASTSLMRLAAGNRVDYRPPFYVRGYKDKKPIMPPRTEIVEILDAKLKSVRTGDAVQVVLDGIESDERGQIGVQSMFLPYAEDGPKKADAVYSDKSTPVDFDQQAWDSAIEWFTNLVPRHSLDMISIEEAVEGQGSTEDPALANDGMDTDTNSGMPYMKSSWKPKSSMRHGELEETERVFKYVMNNARVLVSTLKAKVTQLPYFVSVTFQRLVQRGQKPFDPKSKRLVMGSPKEQVIAGNTAGKPITQALKNIIAFGGVHLFPALVSLPEIDLEMQKVLRIAEQGGYTVVSGDVSGMDASLIPKLMLDVGKAFAKWVRGGEEFVSQMVEVGIYRTYLVTPVKLYTMGPSSNKSGDPYTTIQNCGYLATAIKYGEIRGYYSIAAACIHGDDSVTCGPGLNPESLSKALGECGLTANPTKQFYKPGALHFLQRLHIPGRPGGIYSVYRALGHAMSLERFEFRPGDWTGYTYTVRMLAQAQNCCFNPYIRQLVEVMRDGDKFHLGEEFTNPEDMLSRAGSVGETIARTGSTDSADWRRVDKAMSFQNWLPNGLLRGEEPPPAGIDLFRRVYGEKAKI